MPANYDELFSAFANLGLDPSGESTYYGRDASGVEDWIDIFESTGIDFTSHAQTIDAFENFLIAFYPQEGLSKFDWDYVREDFYEMYGISDESIDWEAWREAIGYGRD